MTIVTDVPCSVCGCACDDLSVSVDDGWIVAVERGCELAKVYYLQPPGEPGCVSTRSLVPSLARPANELLQSSLSPLIFGFQRASTRAIRAGIALAEKLGGTIDLAGDHAGTLAFQRIGESTCTLGDIKQRADLVIFWGCDPQGSHPRLIERYCSPREGRRVIFKKQGTEVPCSPDEFLDCQFGVIFYDSNLPYHTVEALHQLAIDLNDHDTNTRRRFYTRRLHSAVSGAESVLTWQTGYPFGVNFALGYPRYNGLEYTAETLLSRREVDACVIVGVDSVKTLSERAVNHLKTLPLIVIDTPARLDRWQSDEFVPMPIAEFGLHGDEVISRLDGVRLPLPKLMERSLPSDGEMLESLLV